MPFGLSSPPLLHGYLRDWFRGSAQSRHAVWIRRFGWGYFVLILAAWLLLHLGADRWWPATLILFGPRWLLSLPLLILVPLAAWLERRRLYVLFVAAAILFGPLMGLCIPFRGASAASKCPAIRVLTCNVGGSELDAEKLRHLIDESGADVVALQECPNDTAAKMLFGWMIVQDGELVIASHHPTTPEKNLQAIHPPHRWPRSSLLQCRIKTTEGELLFGTVHLPSPRYGLDNLLDRHAILNLSRMKLLNEEQELRRKTSQGIADLMRRDALPVIVAGDFNMPVESALYRQFWTDYSNAFSTAGFGYGLTEKINIQGFGYKVRIDHIISRNGLVPAKCWVGPDVGSDHLPVIAEFCREK